MLPEFFIFLRPINWTLTLLFFFKSFCATVKLWYTPCLGQGSECVPFLSRTLETARTDQNRQATSLALIAESLDGDAVHLYGAIFFLIIRMVDALRGFRSKRTTYADRDMAELRKKELKCKLNVILTTTVIQKSGVFQFKRLRNSFRLCNVLFHCASCLCKRMDWT